MITLLRYFLILMAIVFYIPWRLWIFCGWIADKRAQQRIA